MGDLTMAQDRRNYARRAEATRAVILRVTGARHTVGNELSLPAFQRILKGLALRGLVRLTSDGWRPSSVLISPAPLRPNDGLELVVTESR